MRFIHVAQLGFGLCAGLLLGGVATASAAQIGTLTARSLASSAVVVAACDTNGITATWETAASPEWLAAVVPANSTFNVTRLKLTGVANGCGGQSYGLVVADSSGTALQTLTGTIAGPPDITFTLPATNSKSIAQVIIMMYG